MGGVKMTGSGVGMAKSGLRLFGSELVDGNVRE